MKAIITVTGKDSMGIIAKVSALCTKYGANIVDISQTVMEEYFAMIMLVNLEHMHAKFDSFSDALDHLADENGLKIHAMHEDVFNSMHRI
ncbi:MAG: ACT domain-containing protein [Clostridia bacterium]|nr:ACT domain-containing protein [Clostridia bacterium]